MFGIPDNIINIISIYILSTVTIPWLCEFSPGDITGKMIAFLLLVVIWSYVRNTRSDDHPLYGITMIGAYTARLTVVLTLFHNRRMPLILSILLYTAAICYAHHSTIKHLIQVYGIDYEENLSDSAKMFLQFIYAPPAFAYNIYRQIRITLSKDYRRQCEYEKQKEAEARAEYERQQEYERQRSEQYRRNSDEMRREEQKRKQSTFSTAGYNLDSAAQLFRDCKSQKELHSRYLLLAKKYHPDMGGDEDFFKAINDVYRGMAS